MMGRSPTTRSTPSKATRGGTPHKPSPRINYRKPPYTPYRKGVSLLTATPGTLYRKGVTPSLYTAKGVSPLTARGLTQPQPPPRITAEGETLISATRPTHYTAEGPTPYTAKGSTVYTAEDPTSYTANPGTHI